MKWLRNVSVRYALVAVAIVAVAGVWLSGAFGAPSEISWTEATRGDLVVRLDVEGTLASRDSSVLTPPSLDSFWDFKIAFMAPEGSEAEEGMPVLAFDATELNRRLLQLQTEAEQAIKNIDKHDADQRQRVMDLEIQQAESEAQLRRAELKDDVPEDLRAANDAEVAALDVDLAKLEVESVRGQIEAARRAGDAQRASMVARKDRAERLVRETQAAIESLTVKAPRAGTVIYITNWRGEKKKVGDGVWRRERIIELPNLNEMVAQGEVDEADAGRVEVGQPVTLRLDAHPDFNYDARIESIWSTVQRKSQSRSPLKVIRLDLALDETDTERMRPGMRFRGTIESERFEDTLMVPLSAVFPTDDGPIVYRRTRFGFERVAVQLGTRNDTHVQVLGGLEAGALVAESNPES